MATTTTVHAQLIRYTTGGDQIVINLKTTASDVSVDRTSNSKIPSSVSTAQGLADVLGNLAFKDTIADASTSASGLMTAAMVTKLNGIASGANAYSHPTYTSRAAGLYKITVDGTGHVSATTAVGKSDITALGIPGQDTKYGVFAKATADANGGTGLVPAPTKGQQGLYLRGDGTWGTPTNTVYSHPNSGVTAGTYKSVTVNAQGHVTAGSNPTTLAGYGITDAVSSSDSRLTNSRPASDVYAWAKATSKPSYSKSEVGLGNVDNTADSAKSVKYATSAGSAGSASQFSFTELSDTDLNTLTTEGKIYFSGGSNTCKNGPVTAGTAFELFVGRNASGYRYQRFITLDGEIYIRRYDSNDWSGWKKLAFTTDTVDVAKSANSVAWGNVSGKPSTFTPSPHTHNYAGSGSAGGSANSAVKLDTATAGSATQPVYFTGGKPTACSYTLGKSVPSNAVFTDTTYSVFKAASASAAGGTGLVPAPAAGKQGQFLRGDGTWAAPADTNTWRPLGTTADTACAGNDSRLSNSRPASDVYAWAKAASKPSYSWGEISGKPSTFSPSSHSHSAASASAAGFMSASDKSKLDLGEVVYVSKTAPTKQCIWIKLD